MLENESARNPGSDQRNAGGGYDGSVDTVRGGGMMETETRVKHTPKPWYVVEKEYFGFSIRANTETGSEIIAETGGFNSEANTQLIAAAPELLEALKKTIGHLTDDCPIKKSAIKTIHLVEPEWQ